MTLLPSTLAQSTLGEKCAVYLDQVADNIPVHLETLRLRVDPILTYLSTTLGPLAQKLPFDIDEQTFALTASLIVCVLTIVAMSWRNILRRSPSYAPASSPHVSDADFSYITPGEVDGRAASPDAGPDIIRLKHRGTNYPLHFEPYSIGESLTVGELRARAANTLGVSSTDYIRLLYKGKLLKDDAQRCREEGIKQNSEIMCVVSDFGPGNPSDVSEDNGRHIQVPAPNPARYSDAEQSSSPPTPRGKTGRKKNNKKKNKTVTPPEPVAPPRPSSSGGSGNPAPPPNIKLIPSRLAQVSALAGWLQEEMIPLVDEYVADPPTDPKKRDFEYKKLSETILAQVMLKADGIEPDGDVTIRNARKALIKDAQAALNKLDTIAKL
ncbi:hypothetical protein PENANT_c014G06184 [Penicillium antarcticum]|uniref:BAG domain-containing protein n=1 Tax=Penicillium antarcticum TaxID=416450 RepID=A0A1V6Q4K0_9EURO|nr:uncharacterized protein N7508_009557 [Penicillium antarcticum]KAJ5294736.1 hypothetical protein N7508_009557 [Penicillium antarcticum]OQD83937.1 hypothetical protein PENANT_c014G06184 [Penicillium antarcticum]